MYVLFGRMDQWNCFAMGGGVEVQKYFEIHTLVLNENYIASQGRLLQLSTSDMLISQFYFVRFCNIHHDLRIAFLILKYIFKFKVKLAHHSSKRKMWNNSVIWWWKNLGNLSQSQRIFEVKINFCKNNFKYFVFHGDRVWKEEVGKEK